MFSAFNRTNKTTGRQEKTSCGQHHAAVYYRFTPRFCEGIETGGLDCCRAVVVQELDVKSKRCFFLLLDALEEA